MVSLDGEVSYQFFYSHWHFVASVFGLCCRHPATTNTGFIKSLIGDLSSESALKTQKLWQSIGSAD